MIELNDMAVFTAVVENGSFTASAKQMGVSKSAVSKQISRLEDSLGIRLLNRTTRRLSLTEAGEIFYQGCQDVMAAAEQAEHAVSRLSDAPRGTLKVNAPMSFGVKRMGPMVADFMARYPEIEVDLVLNDQVVDLVEEGFDVAIRIGRLMDSRLIARRLAPCRIFLLASADYLARHGTPREPTELTGHGLLGYRYRSQSGGLTLIGEEGTVSVTPRRANLTANNGDFILAAAEQGLGIASLPTFICADAIHEGRVVRVLPEWEVGMDVGIHVVYPINRNLPPKARVFIDYLVQRFKEEPEWDRACAQSC